jgi:hypothetical protein
MPEVICGDKTGGNLASIVRKPATWLLLEKPWFYDECCNSFMWNLVWWYTWWKKLLQDIDVTRFQIFGLLKQIWQCTNLESNISLSANESDKNFVKNKLWSSGFWHHVVL